MKDDRVKNYTIYVDAFSLQNIKPWNLLHDARKNKAAKDTSTKTIFWAYGFLFIISVDKIFVPTTSFSTYIVERCS